jgi:hypothetical protein
MPLEVVVSFEKTASWLEALQVFFKRSSAWFYELLHYTLPSHGVRKTSFEKTARGLEAPQVLPDMSHSFGFLKAEQSRALRG